MLVSKASTLVDRAPASKKIIRAPTPLAGIFLMGLGFSALGLNARKYDGSRFMTFPYIKRISVDVPVDCPSDSPLLGVL